MIRLGDWDTYWEGKQFMTRLGVLNPVEWLDSVHQEHPMLDALYESGEFEKYETMFALLGESYVEYYKEAIMVTIPLIRRAMPSLLASQLVGVQPMSAPTGTIIKI